MDFKEFTKYEVARILGARALQLSMNAPILLVMKDEELEEINYDPLKIAEKEFENKVLPITVKRPLPERVGEGLIEDEESEIIQEIIPEENSQEKHHSKNMESIEKESAKIEAERMARANE